MSNNVKKSYICATLAAAVASVILVLIAIFRPSCRFYRLDNVIITAIVCFTCITIVYIVCYLIYVIHTNNNKKLTDGEPEATKKLTPEEAELLREIKEAFSSNKCANRCKKAIKATVYKKTYKDQE